MSASFADLLRTTNARTVQSLWLPLVLPTMSATKEEGRPKRRHSIFVTPQGAGGLGAGVRLVASETVTLSRSGAGADRLAPTEH